jgi:hypothetical protein
MRFLAGIGWPLPVWSAACNLHNQDFEELLSMPMPMPMPMPMLGTGPVELEGSSALRS